MTYTPVWSYFEYIVEWEMLEAEDDKRLASIALREQLDSANSAQKIIDDKQKQIASWRTDISNLRNILARPLYKAARINLPHPMSHVLEISKPLLPTLKPYGELAPYIGECILQFREGAHLILNVAPEGCMVSAMGEMLTPQILEYANCKGARIQYLFSLNGEIDQELLKLALLKTRGPEMFYASNG